ncbi:MAG: IS66 family insertion sequence element accessory protein TnpB [Candidatus Thiodiazotropha sp.]
MNGYWYHCHDPLLQTLTLNAPHLPVPRSGGFSQELPRAGGDRGSRTGKKSLAEEKFRWPRAEDQVMPLSGEQINWLLSGYDISLMEGHKILHYESLF